MDWFIRIRKSHQMPSDCSDVYVDLDCSGADSMKEKHLDMIIAQIQRTAKREG